MSYAKCLPRTQWAEVALLDLPYGEAYPMTRLREKLARLLIALADRLLAAGRAEIAAREVPYREGPFGQAGVNPSGTPESNHAREYVGERPEPGAIKTPPVPPDIKIIRNRWCGATPVKSPPSAPPKR